MTAITVITIGVNYPENILIESLKKKDEEKWGSIIYLLRDGEIHNTLVSTDAIFDTEEEAKQYMVDASEWCVNYVKENEVFDL